MQRFNRAKLINHFIYYASIQFCIGHLSLCMRSAVTLNTRKNV